jgi:ectoine hydroxylase-related dioxygenase (phytanoyl-CoA dioxygenase family)
MNSGRYTSEERQAFAQAALRDGYCILKDHLPVRALRTWREALQPMLEDHIAREGHIQNRGSARYYVTLPFQEPFADPAFYEDPDVLAIVESLVGDDPVMPQLASDTPLLGSDYQEIHRDTGKLFPEMEIEPPMYQLAVNFPLVDVTAENGPFEVAPGTHMMPKQEGLRLIESGQIPLIPIMLKLGDVMIRDVRGLHRGTPNRTNEPRPMVVIGYSRKWLFRPEVSIRVPRAAMAGLSPRAKRLLRYNPVVESLDEAIPKSETYQAFAY